MQSKQKFLMLALSAMLFASCTKERFINQPGNLVPKTVDQDPVLPSISVHGARLHSEAFGHPDSTMIVFIHGGPGSDYRYLLNGKDLADCGYRVVFYDQRGSGLSQRFPKKFYINQKLNVLDMMYDELSAVIAFYRTRPNQKVILMGHSWGGILATAYAGKHPEAIQGLVVCEPGGLKWNDIEKYVAKSRSFNIWGEALNDAVFIDQFLSGSEDNHEILDYKLSMLAAKNDITGEDNTEPGSYWRSGAVISTALFEIGEKYKPDFSDGIERFKVPVLFFFSENNRAYPQSWAQKVSGVYPSSNVVKVTGAGHNDIVSDRNTWAKITLPEMLSYIKSL